MKKQNNFIESRFPDDISYGSSGGPLFYTDVVTINNGFEQRNINWQHSRLKFNVAYGVKTQEQLSKMLAFFRICKGRALGFRFKDWSDYRAQNIELINDGKTKVFQLIKTYHTDGDTTERIINKPVQDTVHMYIDDEEVNNFTVNYATGKLVLPNSIEGKITVCFEFDVPVRFDIDHLSIALNSYLSGSVGDISIIEIRV